MSTESLIVRELVVALVGATASSLVARSPIVDPYKMTAVYVISGLTAFWCLRLAGLV